MLVQGGRGAKKARSRRGCAVLVPASFLLSFAPFFLQEGSFLLLLREDAEDGSEEAKAAFRTAVMPKPAVLVQRSKDRAGHKPAAAAFRFGFNAGPGPSPASHPSREKTRTRLAGDGASAAATAAAVVSKHKGADKGQARPSSKQPEAYDEDGKYLALLRWSLSFLPTTAPCLCRGRGGDGRGGSRCHHACRQEGRGEGPGGGTVAPCLRAEPQGPL